MNGLFDLTDMRVFSEYFLLIIAKSFGFYAGNSLAILNILYRCLIYEQK